MADVPDTATGSPLPPSGLAIYVAENSGELRCPVLLLIDEEDDFKMVDVFTSEWDLQHVYEHLDNYFSWPTKKPPNGDSFRPEIETGELTRIGPMPRKHVFYRRE